MHYSIAAALVALTVLSKSGNAHSWIDQLTLIDSTGHFVGSPGYARAYLNRSAPDFTDTKLVHILPPSDPLEARDIDTVGIKPTDPMCRQSQRGPNQSQGYPRLSASPGSMIALRYQENGHVTLPQNSIRKPPNRGTVYVYGTTQPKNPENFLDVFKKWNEAGTGGDKRGRLLAKQNFDDGRCYQVNPKEISQQRQKEYPHTADPLMGMDMWCQNDLKLPTDIPAGKPYTIYWVWDWPTLPGQGAAPEGKAEIYTSCMDLDITNKQARSIHEIRGDPEAPNGQMDAIPAYMAAMTKASTSSNANAGSQAHVAGNEQSAPASQASDGQVQVPAQAPAPAKSSPPPPATTTAAAAAPNSEASEIQSAESVVFSALGPKVITELAAQLTAGSNAAAAAASSPAAAAPNGQQPPQQQQQPQSPQQSAQQQAPPPASTATLHPTLTTSTTKVFTITKTANPNAIASQMPSSLEMAPPAMSPSAAAPAPAAQNAQSSAPAPAQSSAPAQSPAPAQAQAQSQAQSQSQSAAAFSVTASPAPSGQGNTAGSGALSTTTSTATAASAAASASASASGGSCKGQCYKKKRSRIFGKG